MSCATEVADNLGFPFAWMPVPSGWTPGGVGDVPGFVGRFGVPQAAATERLHLAGVLVVIASGGVGDQPAVSAHAQVRWRGVLVTEASGVPPQPNEAAWVVYDTWVMEKHGYRLYVMALPKQGAIGTVASGILIARQVRDALEYTAPTS